MDRRSGAGEGGGATSEGERGDGSAGEAHVGRLDAAAGGGGREPAGEGGLVSHREAAGSEAAGLADALDLLAARTAGTHSIANGAPLRACNHCLTAAAAALAIH